MAWTSQVLATTRWNQAHLLGIRDLSRDDLLSVLSVARELKNVPPSDAPLRGRRLLAFFVESSTRTRTSFGIAARRLGMEVIDVSPGSSSLSKGESLKDTTRTIDAMGVDQVVIRHPASGAPRFVSNALRASVINAGDGANEHPTQALLDLFTMEERLGRVTGLRIALVGDILHSRVARSNLWAHRLLGNRVTVVGPATLVPRDVQAMGADVSHRLDPVLETHDVIMMLRLQLERQHAGLFPSTAEYAELFGLTRERLARLREDTIVMHPGPMNRGWEISAEAADSGRSVILDQVANGVFVRMAVLLLLDSARGKNLTTKAPKHEERVS
ncbi:MAG: aspartate carbamoyltransferase catalytic subunit [Planctomycetes bacterium]|nr:aspartate carbamoyltransferase catalytic subunit [Planctomycetota bacterium]